MASQPKEGDKAPDFAARDANGDVIRLKDLRGKKVVLYFYPKDDTPGCTKEACAFRDAYAKFKKRGIEVRRVGPMHRVRRPANLDALSGRDALTDPIDDGVIFGVAEFALND